MALSPTIGYTRPSFAPLDRIRIVDEFPWRGPSYSFLGKDAIIIGMEARLAVVSDEKYGNDYWDYKLEIAGEPEHPPVWLPSSCLIRTGLRGRV